MNQGDIAGQQVDHVLGQVAGSHALEHHRGGIARADRIGDAHDPISRDDAVGGIGAQARRAADLVPHGNATDARTHRNDMARTFRSQRQGQGGGVEAGAIIGVDEIEADRILRDQHFAFTGRARIETLAFDRLGAAMGPDDHPVCFVRHQASACAKKSAVRRSASWAASSTRRSPISAAKP